MITSPPNAHVILDLPKAVRFSWHSRTYGWGIRDSCRELTLFGTEWAEVGTPIWKWVVDSRSYPDNDNDLDNEQGLVFVGSSADILANVAVLDLMRQYGGKIDRWGKIPVRVASQWDIHRAAKEGDPVYEKATVLVAGIPDHETGSQWQWDAFAALMTNRISQGRRRFTLLHTANPQNYEDHMDAGHGALMPYTVVDAP